MAVNLSPIWGAGAQLFDNSGNVLSGGKIYTYAAGTTTPAATYTSFSGITANSNPIILNSAGRVPYEIWLSDTVSYKFVLKDSNDVLIATYDNLIGINSNFIAYTAQQEIQTATAGQTVFDLTTMQYQPGTNSLSVFVDGVNQYGPGAQYAYVETDTDTVTFVSGLHDGASVKFTTATPVSSSSTDAENVSYTLPYAGSVGTNVQTKLSEYISVYDFGAVGDGVTDDTTAIQTAIDSAVAHGQQITAYGTFKITAKIVIKGDTDFSQATFNVYGTPAIAVEISTGNGANPTDELNNCVVWLPKRIENMTKPVTGWAGQGIGVRTVNTYSCQIFVGNIVNFATGLLLTSYNTNGNTYNNYYLGSLENNQVNLALTPGDSTSWANENNFYGGRFSQYSGEGTNVSGVRHILLSKSTNSVNNNMFTKPSLEGDTPEYHVENGGAYNTILQGRWEATTPKVLYIADNANQGTVNDIISGYNARSIQFTFSGTSGFNNKVIGADQNNYDTVGGSTGSYKIMNAGSSSNPIHTFYEASSVVRPENATSSQWAVQHSAQFLQAKRTADAYARVKLDYVNGGIGFTNGAVAPANQLFSNGSADNLYVQNALAFVPYPNNTLSLGASSYKWTVVYATTGTINTSDGNQKEQVKDLTESEQAVAKRIKNLIKTFKFKDAVESKSDKARIHVGVIAQDVKTAFETEGLDATQYGLFCSDILEDGTEQLGIRYEELLAFVIAAL